MGQGAMGPTARQDRLMGLLFVVFAHLALLYGLWTYRLLPPPAAALTMFVQFIAPPAMEKPEPPRPEPKPRPVEKPLSRQLVAEIPAVKPMEYVAPPPPPPVPETPVPAPAMTLPVGPVNLTTELAVTCPERGAPAYPTLSRRLGETGVVVLRVELDESGRVASVRIHATSGHARLDEAAVGAVKTWRCTPALRNGQPVRASALQPFNFILQGN